MGMTREEARNELVLWRNRNSDNGYHYKFVEALTIAIKALEQQPCEDYISRQAAIDCLNADFTIDGKENMETVVDYINGAFEQIKALPSVTPQQKVGEWNFIGDCMFECSSCKTPYTQQQLKYMCNYTYEEFPKCCPNCGAKNGK